MPLPYRILLDLDCLDELPKSGKRRDDVLAFCRDLKEAHVDGGDLQVIDPETHRMFEVSTSSDYIITWWVDHPVKRVLIVDIRRYSL